MAVHSSTIYSKLARIHKAGCHTAALTGCGGRESADDWAPEECISVRTGVGWIT
ncbi:MAG: hypothetical protein GQ533_09965 [Methanosarcinaceae archaeon]|nr:hypothetical protein [Methanosarcinaceae archaeon]